MLAAEDGSDHVANPAEASDTTAKRDEARQNLTTEARENVFKNILMAAPANQTNSKRTP
jgi:hypothetical protein